MAQQSESNLAKTIQAKLQIRKGNNSKAAKLYTEIIHKIKSKYQANTSLDLESCTAVADKSILSLSVGHITEAFDLLVNYTGGEYWQDLTYIAEHLLPLDVLIKKVDSYGVDKNHDKPSNGEYRPFGIFNETNKKGKTVAGIQHDYITALRYLTARRLIRADKFQQAAKYLSNLKQQAILKEMIALNTEMKQSSGKQKAAKLFKQAQWIKGKAWRLYAYDGFPDWLMFDLQYANSSPIPNKAEEQQETTLIHQSELNILEQNNTMSLPRYSYRFRASKLAITAANMLDFKDKNYEKYMCFAAKWVLAKDAKLGYKIFKQYVKNAKPTQSVKYFGQRCED